MENYMSFSGRRVGFLWLTIGVFLFLLCCPKAESKLEPRRNVNLSPFWGWRSAYECMLNVSNHCSEKDKLTLDGVIDVNQTEVADYCNDGCAQHTQDVLQCIHDVKRDFWFANHASVHVLSDAITTGCTTSNSKGISTVDYSNAVKSYQHLYMTLISSLPAAVFLLMFNM